MCTFFPKCIQSKCMLQSFLEMYYYFCMLLSHLKQFFYGFTITLFPQKPQFSPNERLARVSVHKGVECKLEEFVRNAKQKKLSFTV